MAYHLPSLNALRAFEAAARHLSFTRAADELCVTQGAVSRHIGILEDALGVRLFIRVPRHVELTPAAETYLIAVQQAFDRIDAATRELTHPSDPEQISVLCLPTFASRWLMPRLHRFNQLHPEASIRLSTATESLDADRDGVDIAIGGAPSTKSDVRSEPLLDVAMIPICSSFTVSGLPPPTDVADIGNYTLLHALAAPELWQSWADTVGAGNLADVSGSSFATIGLVAQAAQEGLGIGIGASAFIKDELAAGTLIVPFPGSSSYCYYLNVAETKLCRRSVASFRNWIVDEARSDPSGQASSAPPTTP